jgi:hypothetical protein
MRIFYTTLFTLLVILINPWGADKGAIWLFPRIAVLLAILFCNVYFLQSFKFSKKLIAIASLWGIFLGETAIATLNSPFPLRSFWGHPVLGDGWIYHVFCCLFFLSNVLLLQQRPELRQSQINGVLVGCCLLVLAMLPQLFNWAIDYTETSGQVVSGRVLQLHESGSTYQREAETTVSGLYQNQQPVGLYSHKGIAAVPLLIGVFISPPLLAGLLSLGLAIAKVRGAIVALVVAGSYLFIRKNPDSRISGVLIAAPLLIFTVLIFYIGSGAITESQIKAVTSDRFELWKIAFVEIQQKPLLGWGFDGFGVAYPHGRQQLYYPKMRVVNQNDFGFELSNGKIEPILTTKAHNLLLDKLLDVGAIGSVAYFALLGFTLWTIWGTGLEVAAIAYLVYVLTWYETAQTIHLFWWACSVGFSVKSVNSVKLWKHSVRVRKELLPQSNGSSVGGQQEE